MNNTFFKQTTVKAFAAFFAALVLSLNGYAAEASIPCQAQAVSVSSGSLNGNGTSYYKAFSTRVSITGAPWILLHFQNASLGSSSYIEMVNSSGKSQILDGTTLPAWNNYSAFFNGDHVDVNLYAAPNDLNIHMEVDTVLVGQAPSLGPTPSVSPNSCDVDQRQSSNEGRIGRFVSIGSDPSGHPLIVDVGTAFLGPYGNFFSAGHNITLSQNKPRRIQFNVPPSDAGVGTPQFPTDPNDQYAVDDLTIQYHDNGVGDDWAVFNVTDNYAKPIAGKLYFVLQQPASLGTVSITGYGKDERNYQNLSTDYTQQTATGSLVSYADNILKYNAFIEIGTSGGPVIDNTTGVALGINTHKYCFEEGVNKGTSFSRTDLGGKASTAQVHVHQNLSTSTSGSKKIRLGNDVHVPKEVGMLRRWVGLWDPPLASPGQLAPWDLTFAGDAPNSLTFLADDFVYTDDNGAKYKFHDWNGNQYKLVGADMPVTNSLVSWFNQIAIGVSIKAEILGAPNFNDGVIEFKDPWVIDRKDAAHSDVPINGGVEGATFKQRTGTFRPDLTTSYTEGTITYKYNGVFLNQKTQDGIYYSVRAPLTQAIGGFSATFDHWEATTTDGVSDADIVDIGVNTSGYDTKAVVFKTSTAGVKAMYKATLSATVASGWNMASVPVQVSNFAKTAVWPTATSNAFTWENNNWVIKNQLENGKGYWVKFGYGQ
ncbi:MAG: hypothetical protein HYR76_12575, partial [Ignavibacteria bacterium]|nr:hypothetical protein [Ignavibacteria bacterium]